PFKRVAVDLIARFAQIDSIQAVVEQSKHIGVERTAKKLKWDAQKVAAANAALEFQETCTEWQLQLWLLCN
ncbi:hypothetical protein K432DRAFT_309694, partial [Lepidopterella palustris CBS 459.81]